MCIPASSPQSDPPAANGIATPPVPAYNRPLEARVTVRTDFLKQTPFFAKLAEPELQAIAADLVRRQFRSGETIFHQGDPGHVLYLIESGRVRIYVQGEDGQETSVILYGSGDVFGDLAVIDEEPRSASAAAMEPTTVLTLSRERFHEHLRRSPQLALNFLQVLSVRLRYSTEQVGNLAFLDVPGRLARRLLGLAQRYGVPVEGGVRIDVPLNQTDLASLVGTTRESVNKAVGSFRRQGLIAVHNNYITILDSDALGHISS